MDFNVFSFQPAAFVGDRRRWKEDNRTIEPYAVWARTETGAGTRPPSGVPVSDERCNRTAWGLGSSVPLAEKKRNGRRSG